MSECSNSDGQDQARAQRIRALLELVALEQLFPQYVDLRHRSLQTVIVTDAEPPTFSDDAFDTRRAHERIKGYLIWTDALNEQRKDTGKRIDDLLESSKNDQAAAMAGVQEIGLHLLTITADAVAKHFGVLSEKMGVEVEAPILNDIRMFGTLRNDFEHLYDGRGISGRHGKRIFDIVRAEDGTTAFNWKHSIGDFVSSRKGSVPISEDGIRHHRQRVYEGLQTLREHAISQLAETVRTPEQEEVMRWLLQREITTNVRSQSRANLS